MPLALAQGWAVAIPDHLGPDSAYGAAKLGGMITLDGVRALKRLPELRLSNSPVALAGTRAAVWPPHGRRRSTRRTPRT